MKKIISIAAACLVMAGAAHAQQAKAPLYGEIGYTQLKYSAPGFPDAKPGMLRGIIGYDLHPNIALEGMLGFGVKDDSFNIMGVDLNVKAQHAYGVFVKPKINPTKELELFARVGYTRFKTKVSVLGVSGSSSEGDFSYGAGLNYNITPTTHIGVDYINYYKKDGAKIDGLTVGVGFRF